MSKIIHQIWIQGEHNLPLHLQECKKSVVEYNSDFEIIYWDYDKMVHFIKKNRPDFISNWNGILETKQPFIKIMDTFTWLVLYEYGGFYIDRDIKIHKPLNTLYNSLSKDVYLVKEKVEKLNYMKTDLGFKMYSYVKKRFDYVYQDSFRYSIPKSKFCESFLNHAYTKREDSILNSFSVWSLTDFINNGNDIGMFDENDISYGNTNYGYATHFFENGWIDRETDNPWETESVELITFNLYRI